MADRLLREVVDADLPAFFDHRQDPEAIRMAAFPARDADAFSAHWAKILRDEKRGFTVCGGDGDELALELTEP